jgi:hypothetical protein
MSILDWFRVDMEPYKESTLDLLKRKSVERGLDPAYWDEIANLPPEPQGPDDPGRLGTERVPW